jgi:hypothetical protein
MPPSARLYSLSNYPEGPALTGHLGTGFLISLCLKANTQVVSNTPSSYRKLLM